MTTSDSQPTGWEGLLDPGEDILWQGSPDPGWHMGLGGAGLAVFGIFFAGFALFWMTMAGQAGGNFWMFGLIHFAVGVGMILGAIFYPTYRRRHTFYTLTDRRAFIATDLPILGRKLKSYPIDASTPLSYTPGPLATIHFATERRRTKNGSHEVAIGFERIHDGEAAYRLMREIQTKQLD